jgi:hypothetical protein
MVRSRSRSRCDSNQREALSIEYPVDSSISEEQTLKAATKTRGKKRVGCEGRDREAETRSVI